MDLLSPLARAAVRLPGMRVLIITARRFGGVEGAEPAVLEQLHQVVQGDRVGIQRRPG